MAHWDSVSGQIVDWPPVPVDGHDGWEWVDCGCAAGLEWGGESPRECSSCNGSGRQAYHPASGVYALYPGGPLQGRDAKRGGKK